VIPREWRKFGGIPAQKQTRAGTHQAGDGRVNAADVAYMSQIGDKFDIVQQSAESIP
jgi:hypothetical protein